MGTRNPERGNYSNWRFFNELAKIAAAVHSSDNTFIVFKFIFLYPTVLNAKGVKKFPACFAANLSTTFKRVAPPSTEMKVL